MVYRKSRAQDLGLRTHDPYMGPGIQDPFLGPATLYAGPYMEPGHNTFMWNTGLILRDPDINTIFS